MAANIAAGLTLSGICVLLQAWFKDWGRHSCTSTPPSFFIRGLVAGHGWLLVRQASGSNVISTPTPRRVVSTPTPRRVDTAESQAEKPPPRPKTNTLRQEAPQPWREALQASNHNLGSRGSQFHDVTDSYRYGLGGESYRDWRKGEAKPLEAHVSGQKGTRPLLSLIDSVVNRANGKVDGQSCLLKLKSQNSAILISNWTSYWLHVHMTLVIEYSIQDVDDL